MISHYLAWHRGLIYCCQTWSDICTDLGAGEKEAERLEVGTGSVCYSQEARTLFLVKLVKPLFWKLQQQESRRGKEAHVCVCFLPGTNRSKEIPSAYLPTCTFRSSVTYFSA